MIFSSVLFLFWFLPFVLTVYLLLNESLRNLWLLLASLFFYSWTAGPYVVVLLGCIIFNFACGLLVEWSRPKKWRAVLLAAAVCANLSVLAYAKYAFFFFSNLQTVLGWFGWHLLFRVDDLPQVPLLGVSFFSFHCISYLVDIYRGEVQAERSLLRTALYIAVFPQLLAGPIVLYRQVQHQLPRRDLNLSEFEEGVIRFVLGLAKKVLIADVLAGPADAIFQMPANALSPGLAWLAVPLFTLQIYYDFSGYTDMAIGMGLMLGFRFPENFAYPLAASTVADFWSRWHMSLTNWFRSYLFFPLAKNQSSGRGSWQILAVLSLVGLWHGANWTFLLFGIWNGLAFVSESRLRQFALFRSLNRFYLWGVLWVGLTLFRAPSLAFVVAILKASLGRSGDLVHTNLNGASTFLSPHLILVAAVAVLGCTKLPSQWFSSWQARSSPKVRRVSLALGSIVLCGLFFLCAARIAASTYHSFIYFQF